MMKSMIKSRWVQRLAGGRMERLGIGLVSRINHMMLGAHKDPETVCLLKQIRRERYSLVTGFEAYLVYSLARSIANLPGDIAEVGVYQGSTARLICEVKEGKRFRLFDTFTGLPPDSNKDDGVHETNMYACSLESVQKYLQDFNHLTFHQGLFPDSASDLEDDEYCFVHLDVDLYDSTLACLEYFYPRMVPGAILLSHDYSVLTGVRKAFTEFLEDKQEGLIELPTTQCMIVKLPTNDIGTGPRAEASSVATLS